MSAPALGSNTLWLCPLIIFALYMVGPRTGTGVAAASTFVVLGAEVLKAVRPLPLETFTRTDIFLFESTTIVLAGFTCWVVAHRIAREERQAFEKLAEERQRLKASRDESAALVTLLSHDVANPLQVILAGCEELREDDGVDPTLREEVLGDIAEGARRIRSIVDQVRRYKALEAGTVVVPLAPVDLEAALDAALAHAAPLLADKQVQVERQRSASLAPVEAEWASLTGTVLGNLLSNAIKFSHPGATLHVATALAGPATVTLRIEDEGIGIPDDLRPLLFAPDARTSRVGTAGESGTGFGLPLVAMFLDKYGGYRVHPVRGTTGRPGRPSCCLRLGQVERAAEGRPAGGRACPRAIGTVRWLRAWNRRCTGLLSRSGSTTGGANPAGAVAGLRSQAPDAPTPAAKRGPHPTPSGGRSRRGPGRGRGSGRSNRPGALGTVRPAPRVGCHPPSRADPCTRIEMRQGQPDACLYRILPS